MQWFGVLQWSLILRRWENSISSTMKTWFKLLKRYDVPILWFIKYITQYAFGSAIAHYLLDLIRFISISIFYSSLPILCSNRLIFYRATVRIFLMSFRYLFFYRLHSLTFYLIVDDILSCNKLLRLCFQCSIYFWSTLNYFIKSVILSIRSS